MKKAVVLFLALYALQAAAPGRAGAVALNLGLSGWYSWWDYSLKDIRSGKASNLTFDNKFSINSAPMYGPVVSLKIDDRWSLSSLFLCTTQYRIAGAYRFPYATEGLYSTRSRSNNTFKYDLDTSGSYAVTSYFRVFLGFKVQSFTDQGVLRDFEVYTMGGGDMDPGSFDYRQLSYGPGLGAGFTAPLAQNLFLQFNMSGLYMRSQVRTADRKWVLDSTGKRNSVKTWVDLNVLGGNASLSLAYMIEKASTTLSLGFRYQFFKNFMAGYKETIRSTAWTNYRALSEINAVKRNSYKKSYTRYVDSLYGVTAAVVYSIDFSKK